MLVITFVSVVSSIELHATKKNYFKKEMLYISLQMLQFNSAVVCPLDVQYVRLMGQRLIGT